ncbi:hypothetical protein [Curtobacterium sp. Curtsp57]|uniref:hypothetical protein n=1 Tax=Curtobacterium sp. Curtsp57 TaxID=3243047 RepID=UPI0039B384E0
MARIQVLELPAIVEGESATTPFAIVIDQLEVENEVHSYAGDIVHATTEAVDADAIKAATGAVGVVMHTGTLDVA